MVLSEEFISSVRGPPIAANTAIGKDVGIYAQTITPSYAVKTSFKKSSSPVYGLAVNDTHIFAVQNETTHVHVYSRATGKQETLIPFPEKIRCLARADDVLLLGTVEGRLILWEVSTGRQIITQPCHVQAISCLAATPYHILTGSEDSNVLVWSLASLLELDASAEQEPERTLSNHRGAVTALAVGQSTNPDTSICISAAKDKSCIIWNYMSGDVLRTLLFSEAPLCVCLDPCSRALYVSSGDRAIYLVELFGDKALIGPRSGELSSTVIQISSPLGVADEETGLALCLGLNYDGTILLSGHSGGKIFRWSLVEDERPGEIADLNACITNLVFVPPAPLQLHKPTNAISVSKPTRLERQYAFTAKLETSLGAETRFNGMLNQTGFPHQVLEKAIYSDQHPLPDGGDSIAQSQTEELWEVINEQRALQRLTFQRYVAVKAGRQ